MNYKNDQYRNISEAVMEQLGIEEAEDLVEHNLIDEMIDLKHQIESKDRYIHRLEIVVEHLNARMNKLEQVFYEFKAREVNK